MYSTETYRMTALGKFHKIYKFENHVTRNDITRCHYQKKWKSANVREISQIIYHSKGVDESYPKIQVL